MCIVPLSIIHSFSSLHTHCASRLPTVRQEQQEWEETLAEIKAVEERARDVNVSDPEEFEGWFPQGPDDVRKFLESREDGSSPDLDQATPPSRTTAEVLAELDKAEAAGRLLWQGTLAGATMGEVRFDVEPHDAWRETKIGNLALFSQRGTENLSVETTIGGWEKSFFVGAVTKQHHKDQGKEHHSVDIKMFQPVIVSPESKHSIPLLAWKELKKANG